jgi:hypothetical protein
MRGLKLLSTGERLAVLRARVLVRASRYFVVIVLHVTAPRLAPGSAVQLDLDWERYAVVAPCTARESVALPAFLDW